jgi:hypothetical protein
MHVSFIQEDRQDLLHGTLPKKAKKNVWYIEVMGPTKFSHSRREPNFTN